MKLLKIYLLSFLILCSVFVSASVFAEESNVVVTQQSGVNIYSSKIISQDKNNINISFDIVNEDQALSGLKYGIQLIKEDPKTGQSIADTYIPNELINLSPNERLNKNIKYIAPQGLNGSYTIFIFAKNESGLTLGLGTAGKVNLVSSSGGVNILSETCSLSVGENSKDKYSLSQGVDIEKTEVLKLTCNAVNTSKEPVSVTPLYETHHRNVYGEIIKDTEGGDSKAISFKAGENKSFTISLPKALAPQAYDVKVSLINNKYRISNSVFAHYVLRGPSATIQTLSLDKDGYLAGDNAKINFSWSPSADSFPGSRFGSGSNLSNVKLDISIVNSEGKDCISSISKALTIGGYNIDLTERIKTECKNPKVTVELKDESGITLDQKVLSFETKTDLTKTGISSNNKNTLIVILGILIVVGIALYFINLKKKQDETITQ